MLNLETTKESITGFNEKSNHNSKKIGINIVVLVFFFYPSSAAKFSLIISLLEEPGTVVHYVTACKVTSKLKSTKIISKRGW